MTWRVLIPDLILLAGGSLIAYGLYGVSPPLAYIAVGAAMIVLVWRLATERPMDDR